MLRGLLGHFDRQVLFPFFFWSTPDHSFLVKIAYEGVFVRRSPDK